MFLPLMAWAVFTAGCTARPVIVTVDVMKPAEVDLGPIRKLAIADFQGPGGSAVSNQFITKLVAARHYEILERARLARVIDELALSQSGVLDAATAAKIGKSAGVDGLIFGEVDTYQVADERGVTPLRKTRVIGYDTQCDRKGRCYKVAITEDYSINAPTTIRRGHVSVSFRVVGVESGRVLAAKTASRKWEGVNVVDPQPGNDAIVASPPKSITLPAIAPASTTNPTRCPAVLSTVALLARYERQENSPGRFDFSRGPGGGVGVVVGRR
jgi:curli biogenesis system outer membrane secretion channel CsgG